MAAQEQHSEHEGRVGSLYRRHRPRSFADVVGQEPVVRTLRNAVERGKVHHAYLFVGSRGTGKTSMAKILAACLNCEHGPTVEPCGRCDSCLSIAAATSLDVIEMDAASNNSVDDIRELRESVAYAPVSGRRKVYILDEAHMLSTAAWNAFLKTLEEPPPNTVFVLATTEATKVPPTVIDRCHRFDFHRPTVEQIAGVLRRAADAESIAIPPPALAAIARSATGSFRDALGTLEQLVTYSGSEISLDDVLAVLGVADAGLLAEAIDAVAAGDARAALAALERCAAQGRDPAAFAGDLEARLRELMIVQTVGSLPAELSLTAEADAALVEQAERVPHAVVVRLLELLGEALEAIRAGADARTRLELALVKGARPVLDSSLRALLARLERLETERPPAGNVSAVAAQRDIAVPEREDEVSPRGADTQDPAAASTDDGGPAADPKDGAPATAAGARAAAGRAPSQSAIAEARAAEGRAATQSAVAEADGPPPATPGGATLDSVVAMWPAVVDLVRSENARLAAVIEQARPVELSGDEMTLAFGLSFFKKQAERPADRMILTEALNALTGTRWRLAYELREELHAGGGGGEPEPGSEERWLARFMEEFDAEEIPYESPSAPRGDAQGAADLPALTRNEKGA